MSGRRGLVVPQNTFLNTIVKRTCGNHEHFLLASAQIMDAPIVYCSDGFTKLTGYKKNNVVKKKANCSFMYGSLTTKDDVRSLRNAIQEKQTTQIEILLYKKDGTPFWVLLNIALVSDNMDDSVFFLLTFQDITEFKEPINPSYRKHRWTEFNRTLHSKPTPDNPISKAKEEKNRVHIAQLKEDDVDILPEYKQEIPKTPRYVILHCSTAKIVWDWFILIFILYTATSVPFIVCFKFNSVPMTIADTVVDLMFLIDIVLNLHTSYVGDDGAIVFDLKQIRRNYYRSWFFVDIVTSMPYGLLGLLIGGGVGRGITDFISFLKAIRLLRLNRVVRALDQYLEYGFITLILWMLFFCLCAHWMACIFFAIADHYDKFADIGWVRSMSDQTQQPLVIINGTVVQTPTLASLYMSSLYFSLTSLTSIGFGNIAPNTTAEKIFSCVTMIFGGLCYAVIFGQVTAIVQQSQKKSESYHQTLDNMRSFCKLYNVPKEISTRIVDYYMYTWVLNRGVDTNQVLINCPKDLQSDVCIHLNRKVIDGNPAFGELSNAVLRAVARNFAIHRVAPGERMVHEGESLDTLFFIGSGSFEVTQRGKVVGLLGEGDVFGDDVCRFSDVGRSVADVFALTYADVHAIGRDELLNALAFYPEYGIQFAKVFRLSYSLRDEVTMRKLSSHPRAKSHVMPKGMEGRRYSFVEEMQQHAYETDSNGFDLGTPNSQNMTDTDPPSKPFIKFNKPLLSHGNLMAGIPEDGEDGTGDDEDLKRWDDYQNSRDVSEGLINEITGMKSDVRREIEVMGGKMNQLEQNISTILRLLQDQGLKSPGSGFNSTLGIERPATPPRARSRTASILYRVKAEIPEEVLPDWVEMENFGMTGVAKDGGTVNKEVKPEEEQEMLPKKIGGRITNKRQRLAKRKKKKDEKASKPKIESEDEEAENEIGHDLIDESPAPGCVEDERKDLSESVELDSINAPELTEPVSIPEPAQPVNINEDPQDTLKPVDEDLGRLSSSSQREPQKDKGKKKRKKKKGEKTSKRKDEDEEEGEVAMPSGVNDITPVATEILEDMGRHSRQSQPAEPDAPRVASPRPESSARNTDDGQLAIEDDNEQSNNYDTNARLSRQSQHDLAQSENERAASPDAAVADEEWPSSRADTPRNASARSQRSKPEDNKISSGRNSPSGEQPPSGGSTPRAQSPDRHSDHENEQENKQGPPGQDDERPATPGDTNPGRDSRQGAPGDVALNIEDSDDDIFPVKEKQKPNYIA